MKCDVVYFHVSLEQVLELPDPNEQGTDAGNPLEQHDYSVWLHRVNLSSTTMDALQAVILDPRNQEYLAIIKGIRNALVYGAKIRFPHALLMSILFGKGE